MKSLNKEEKIIWIIIILSALNEILSLILWLAVAGIQSTPMMIYFVVSSLIFSGAGGYLKSFFLPKCDRKREKYMQDSVKKVVDHFQNIVKIEKATYT